MSTYESAPDGYADGTGSVMAAVDHSGAAVRLVIADVSRDDTWLTIPRSEAPMLREWR